jgi:hypothetical protein
MSGIMSMLLGAVSSAITDAYFNLVTLLLPGNGTNGAQNNTFLDSSTNNFTITRNGNTTQGTFSPFSQTGWSNFFDGTSDSLLTPGDTNLVLDGNFTIEFFMYLNSLSISAPISSNHGSFTSGAFAAIISHGTASNKLSIWAENINSASFIIASNSTLSISQWYHVALVRNSGVIRLYLNGVDEGNTSSSATITLNGGSTPRFRIGQYWGGTINGYISNLRVVKGTALYTGAFTPSTSPLTTTSQGATATEVELLTCQSSRFVDNSTNAFVMTPSGDASVQAFSPFDPTAEYSAATVGGSGYFDGNDYLTAAGGSSLAFGSGDFSLEAFVYPTASGSAMKIYDGRPNTTAGDYPVLERNASNVAVFYEDATDLITGTTVIPANAWTHILVSRVSGNLRLFINGVQDGSTVSNSINFANGTARPAIGVRGSSLGSDFFAGYISSVRVLIGSGFASVTVPTEPLTAITNTSLLLNYTNAGITDATAKNDLETVGGAQIASGTYTPTATGTSGASTISVSSATGLKLGQSVTGTGIGTNAVVTVISGTTITLSVVNSGTVSGTMTFTDPTKFGGGSMSFDGTGDWLLMPHTVDQMFRTSAFTIEMWVYRNASGTYGLVGKGTATTGWLVSLNSSNQVVFTHGSTTITSTGTISSATWTYIAVVREGTGTNQTKIYINGTNDGTGTVSTDFNQTNSMYVGADRTGGSAFNGYIDDLRITRGVARTVTTTPTESFQLQ